MENISLQRFPNIDALFDGSYINTRALYMLHNHTLPQVAYISRLDGEKAFNAFKDKYGEMIDHVYVYNWVRRKGNKFMYDRNLVLAKNGCVLEFDDDYIEIYYPETVAGFVQELVKFSAAFKQRQRREPLEVNMIVHGSRGYELKAMEIKRTRLDIDLYYEDDFKPVDALIRERLRRKKDKGIVLLHGLPGTGKTSYLRYLVGQIKKRVLFVSPSVAGHLSDPRFY